MRVAVCDDNELCLEDLKERLSTINCVGCVAAFSNLDTFLLSIDNKNRYDVVLMDIDWNQEHYGMDADEELIGICPERKIIYVTGYSDYSQYVFLKRTNLCGFLTKPVNTELLKTHSAGERLLQDCIAGILCLDVLIPLPSTACCR